MDSKHSPIDTDPNEKRIGSQHSQSFCRLCTQDSKYTSMCSNCPQYFCDAHLADHIELFKKLSNTFHDNRICIFQCNAKKIRIHESYYSHLPLKFMHQLISNLATNFLEVEVGSHTSISDCTQYLIEISTSSNITGMSMN